MRHAGGGKKLVMMREANSTREMPYRGGDKARVVEERLHVNALQQGEGEKEEDMRRDEAAIQLEPKSTSRSADRLLPSETFFPRVPVCV